MLRCTEVSQQSVAASSPVRQRSEPTTKVAAQVLGGVALALLGPDLSLEELVGGSKVKTGGWPGVKMQCGGMSAYSSSMITGSSSLAGRNFESCGYKLPSAAGFSS